MSKARELYTRISSEYHIWRVGNRQALKPLLEVAELWRKERRFFSAAICMIDAVHAAWGTNEVHDCLNQVLIDFKASVDSEPPYSLEAIASLHTWLLQLHYVDVEQRSRPASLLQQEMAERLLRYHGDSAERDSYLVRGFFLSTDLDGNWNPSFPNFEVYGGARTKSGADLTMSIPSAFRLFVQVGDYGGAQDIVSRCDTAFTTPGLKGWKLAIAGF
jgi:hypothetical protein